VRFKPPDVWKFNFGHGKVWNSILFGVRNDAEIKERYKRLQDKGFTVDIVIDKFGQDVLIVLSNQFDEAVRETNKYAFLYEPEAYAGQNYTIEEIKEHEVEDANDI